MFALLSFLLIANLFIALQCYKNAHVKGYPVKLFTFLGFVPYFNLVVWVYLLFLPDLSESPQFKQS
ncbi:hypothetical protein ACFOEE_13515 [Pseudoalteromonas fenneropenaei]|uniref:DUF805 domain-containing protein n=1 Tax=Pseudoalteromonas fenneropenaei TaxID=1737459 RepID=A0ABV7CLL9_9GAMM